MRINISFKHLEHTPALDTKINEKSQKLHKYFEGNVDVNWTCYVREDGQHCADIKCLGPSFEYHATSHSETLYKSLDLAINKIEKQVHKKKDKWKKHINHKHQPSLKDQLVNESVRDEEYWENKSSDDDLAS